jgi:hypothetical protein
MNKMMRSFILVFFLAIVFTVFTSGCAKSTNEGDKFVMGGTYRLNEGETIDGNLSVFGGAVTLEKNSTINGNVVLIGGTINAAGTINGGINGLGGSITLTDTAVVQGDVATVGAAVNKSNKAEIQGKIVSQSEGGVQLPDVPRFVAPALLKPFGDALGGLLRALVIGVLAVLVTLFMPRNTARIGDAIVDGPFTAGAIGLLTIVLFPFVVIILAITIIGIPLSAISVVIFGLGLILGWIAIGLEMGNRIATLFKSDWAPAVSAGVGTLVLSLLAALFGAIPCVGWVVPTVIVLMATGGVVITIFGTRNVNNRPSGYVPVTPMPPAAPMPLAAPKPSVSASQIMPDVSVISPVEIPEEDVLFNDLTKDDIVSKSTKMETPENSELEKKTKKKKSKSKTTDQSDSKK